MKDDEKQKKARVIAGKYRLSELLKLEKTQIIEILNEARDEITEKDIIIAKRDSTIAEQVFKLKEYERLLFNKDKYSEYDPEAGGIEKLIYILKENKRMMFSHEIESTILELQPKLKDEWKDTRGNTVRYITRAIKSGRVIKYYIGNGYTYALPEWFDDDGNLIRKYNIT